MPCTHTHTCRCGFCRSERSAPSPEQIRARAAAIRRAWTPSERRKRGETVERVTVPLVNLDQYDAVEWADN